MKFRYLAAIFVAATIVCAQYATAKSDYCAEIFTIDKIQNNHTRSTRVASSQVVPLGLPAKFKIATYNVGLLFENLDFGTYLGWSTRQTRTRLHSLGDHIAELNADIIVVTEAGSLRALEFINQESLRDEYYILTDVAPPEWHLQQKNPMKNLVDVAFLVRKSLPVNFEVQSQDDIKWNDPLAGGQRVSLFRRGLVTLRILRPDTNETEAVIVGVHLKSQKGRPGDRDSAHLRGEQYQKLEEYAQTLIEAFEQDDVPFVLAGDLNFDLSNVDYALRRLFLDVFDGVNPPLKRHERLTKMQRDRKNTAGQSQLDGILIYRRSRLKVLSASTRLPEDLRRLPSDHRAILSELGLTR